MLEADIDKQQAEAQAVPPTPTTTLFLHCDVSGPWDFKRPADDPDQPHLIRFAAVWESPERMQQGAACFIVRPEGWHRADGSGDHPPYISDAYATKNGRKLQYVMEDVRGMLASHARVVCHNRDWHAKILARGFFDCGMAAIVPAEEMPALNCTMRKSVGPVGLKQEGSNRAKWPTLAEAALWAGLSMPGGGEDPVLDGKRLVQVVRGVWHALEDGGHV